MPLVVIASEALKLEVLPEAGASVVGLALRYAGAWVPVLRRTPAEAIASGNSSLMASFALVPWSNRVRDARFAFRGREYLLRANTDDGHAIHGDVRKRPWKTGPAGAQRVELTFDSRDFADVNFPFPFTSRLTYAIDGAEVATSLSVSNAGSEAMPAGIGFHPYFRRKLAFADDRVELGMHARGIHRELLPTSAAVPLAPEEDFSAGRPLGERELDNCFAGWDGRATLRWPASGVTAEIEASAALGHVILYTPRGQPFFALEPVSHANDGFNLLARGVPGSGVHVLEPGETLEGSFRLRLATGA